MSLICCSAGVEPVRQERWQEGGQLPKGTRNVRLVQEEPFGFVKFLNNATFARVPDHVVSVSQLFVRPIVRGKGGKPAALGAKLDISVAGTRQVRQDECARVEMETSQSANAAWV